jgi:hypothetical protein
MCLHGGFPNPVDSSLRGDGRAPRGGSGVIAAVTSCRAKGVACPQDDLPPGSGYEYESVGETEVLDLLDQYLAERREIILGDPECLGTSGRSLKRS